MELFTAGPDGFAPAEQLFVAPTVLANHFVRLQSTSGGASVNHQAYTPAQLAQKLNELFAEVFARPVSPISKKPAAADETPVPDGAGHPEAATPGVRFCKNCGSKVTPGAAFCAGCGSRLQ
jgi:hypothetical protein